MFSWVEIYQELGAHLLNFRDRQDELIATLKEISLPPHNVPMISLRDKADDGTEVELTKIDPFTFFASFNRGLTDKNRITILRFLSDEFALQSPLPKDFDGVPVVDNMSSWYFPYLRNGRKSDDIDRLWDLAEAVVHEIPEQLNAALFERCLDIRLIGMAKLTIGMFWLNPIQYLATDKRIASYAAARGIAMLAKNLASYQNFITQIHEQVGNNHPQISRDAWLQAINPKKYWAGGHKWGDDSQLERFLKNHEWQLGYADGDTSRAAQEARKWFKQIKIGDEFAIKGYGGQSILKIHYLGEVIAKDQENHRLNLKPLSRSLYHGKAPIDAGAGNWFNALLPVTRPDVIEMIFKTDMIEPKSYPLNQILYGPPGTGKTYDAIERAVEIIDSQEVVDHTTAKLRFDELRRAGRIGFVTFHQSFGYEDFVEGIRPVMDDETAQAHYEIRDGTLKEFALRAIASALQSVEVAPHEGPTFEQLWEELAQHIEDDAPYEIDGLKASRYQLALSPRGNLTGDNIQGKAQQPYNASRSNIEKVWRQLPNDQIPTHDKMRAILGKGSHTNFIGAVVVELRRLQRQWKPNQAFIENPKRALTIEDARAFLAGSPDYTLQVLAARFVLIIDEINRGNIAKILGELITLLEADKRLGADNALTATLPFSGEEFALPLNLYLLGTMNTADKSLALLDVALRRRFKFQEYAPNFDACKYLPDNARQVLAELNHRIVLGKDRDYRIGHSFFIKVETAEEWNEVFRSEIIPLLQEYFYGDWDGLRFALGESGSNGRLIRSLGAGQTRGVRNHWQWFFDAGSELNCLQALHDNYFSASQSDAESSSEL